MIGLWKGVGLPSGHPLDGVLENLHWFGKRFHNDMRADALLFERHPARLVAIDPSYIPIRLAIKAAPLGRTAVARKLFLHLQQALRAKGTTASITLRTFEQVESAAMIYDKQPIVDHFRLVSHDELVGMMCVRDDPCRYFFRLRKVTEAGM
ncbi:GXWXG protein [Rhizobium mongolense subsp. loessense]|uniref:GXWXG protein n=2 Tax=Rhizobium mongolense TaxID=57676 RepID=A0A1G4S4P6_9HYPH|nr:GXWXG protein [Rhizobium mongolense subsp. loessense]